MNSNPAAVNIEFTQNFNGETTLDQVDVPQDCPQTGLKKLEPVQVQPPAPTRLTGVEEDVATCKRVANAIDELLRETNTVEKTMAIGGEYAKLHDQLVRNSRFDATRLGWHQAFNQKIFKHRRRHAEYHITIYRALVGNALPTSKLPHALRPLLLLAQLLTQEKLTGSELQGHLDAGEISPLSTRAEIRELLGLKGNTTRSRQTGTTATPDIIQSIPVRELLQLLSPDQRQELVNLVVGEHAGSAAAVKAATEITAVLVKNRKVQDIIAAAGFIPSNFRVIFQVRLAAAA